MGRSSKMAGFPPPNPQPGIDWKAQRRVWKEQARFQREQARLQRRAMRRGSVVGPLLMVAVGVLFLLVELGHLDWGAVAEWFGNWWPLLLIAAGVVRLLEWAADQRGEQMRAAQGLPPLGSRRMGGGFIWLLILLAVFGGLAHAGSRAANWNVNHFGLNFLDPADLDRALGEPHDSDDSLSREIPADGILTVDNPRGDVIVSGTSDDGKMHIAIHKQVFTFKEENAGKKARELDPEISGEGARVAVRVPSVGGSSHADLSIDLPRGVTVMVTSDRGDVKVSAMHAPVTVSSNHGNVDLSGLTGAVVTHMQNDDANFSAHSVTGTVTMDGRVGDVNVSDVHGDVSLDGAISGASHLERVDGSVRFHTHRTDFQMARLDGKIDMDTGSDLSADQLMGPVILNTKDRNITLERVEGNVQIANSNGSVRLTSAAPLGTIDVVNKRGSVDVGVPASAGFVVDASTRRGEISNDFSLAKEGREDSPELRGTVGRGGVSVHVDTTDGDVKLRKAEVAGLPAVAPAAKITVVAPGKKSQP